MKHKTLIIAVFAAGLTLPAAVNANLSDSYIQNALVEICTETSVDDRVALKKTLGHYRISKQNAVEKVVCNGQQLTDFARANQAVKISAMLQPYEDRIKGRVTIKDVAAPAPN